MIRGIDHVVIAVASLDAAAAELDARVGLACTAGGRHPGAGTSNRVAFLGDAYLELMAVEDEQLASQRPIGAAVVRAIQSGGGLVTYAVVEDTLEDTVAGLQANGSRIGPVTHGSRQRPDGETVDWWTAAFDRLGPDAPPFLIRHAMTGAEWGPDALCQRGTFVHPIGSAAVLLGLDIAVGDPVTVASSYASELALGFRMVDDIATSVIGRHAVRLLPERHQIAPAAVVIEARLAAPYSVDALGVRFDFQPISPSTRAE